MTNQKGGEWCPQWCGFLKRLSGGARIPMRITRIVNNTSILRTSDPQLSGGARIPMRKTRTDHTSQSRGKRTLTSALFLDMAPFHFLICFCILNCIWKNLTSQWDGKTHTELTKTIPNAHTTAASSQQVTALWTTGRHRDSHP